MAKYCDKMDPVLSFRAIKLRRMFQAAGTQDLQDTTGGFLGALLIMFPVLAVVVVRALSSVTKVLPG